MVNVRDKGKRGEREFRDLVNAIFELTGDDRISRTPCSGALSWMKGDLVQLSGILAGFHWEVKNEKSVRIWAYIEQAENDARQGKIPVVAFKRGGSKDFYVCLNAKYFLNLLKETEEKGVI